MNNRLKSGFGFYLILLIVLCLGVYFYYLNSQNTTDEYTVNQFEQDLKAGDVTKIVIKQNEEVPTGVVAASIKGKGTKQFYVSDVTSVVDHVTSDYSDVEVHMTDVDRPSIWVSILPYILMTVVFVFVFFMMTAGAGGGGGGNSRMMNFSKSKAKVIRAEDMDVDFTKVAGLQEEKEEVREIVDFLKEPQRFMDAGARIPKGVIMVGPPGTGKTLLAKAIAGEAKVPFFSISGSDFVEMFVGVGAARVRDLFEEAKKNAPCIIFIDEIDAVARRRGSGLGGGHDEREQTLNQMLVEMDGFAVNEGIIVIAATNRVDILDPAILRPGRFDRKISVGKPDVKGRLEILHVHTRDKSLAEDVNLEEIARTTAGFSGADLENLMNESAILAAREQRRFIKKADIDKAIIKVGIGTEKKSRLVPEKERKITAYHETGHAILYHLLPDVGPVYTVSIIPTGVGAAGYTMPLPENDNVFMTKGKMIQDIMVGLGGRIAEELIFDDITTGASQDIKQATAYARAMVTKYGMSEKLGLVNYETQEDDEVFLGRDLGHARPYGEAVAKTIDKEVKAIIDQCYQDAKNIILENMSVLHRCAEELLLKERINQQEFEALFEDTEDAGVQGNGSGDQTEE
ncbi:MAG: ATP-dependent zinc metalloprotease FtsH [Lachnospiraceae bacterium]|nr:ATP-dependent zinc metalloprotease FtsH [Lachnospiraceae bacterium]